MPGGGGTSLFCCAVPILLAAPGTGTKARKVGSSELKKGENSSPEHLGETRTVFGFDGYWF